MKLKVTFNAPVVLSFVFICFVVLIVGLVSGGMITEQYFTTYHSPLTSPLTYIRFFTHVIGHGSWEHFIGNMSYILLLGPILEEKYGSKRLLIIIILTAFVTGIVHYLLFWNSGLCGASGVVFAFILLASFTSFREGELPLTVILVAVIFLGQQIVDMILVRDNISNLSHVIGGIVGAVAGYQLQRKK